MQEDSTTPTTHRSRRRMLGWAAAGSIVAMLMLGSAAASVLAVVGTTIHQTLPISSDSVGYQGDEEECEGAAAPGEVLWHFVLTKTAAASATLTATFDDAGVVNVPSAVKTGQTLHFYITTGEDTLLNATTDAVGKNLNLSHICNGGTTSTTSTNTETTSSDSSGGETSSD